MSGFVTPLIIEEVDEFEGTFQLIEELVYSSDLLGDMVRVPRSFVTDFASVPRMPFAYLVLGGKGNKAAVVHDWLYSCGKLERSVCDSVFAEALSACGYSWLVVKLMYAGVRVGGGAYYKGPNQLQTPAVEAQMSGEM